MTVATLPAPVVPDAATPRRSRDARARPRVSAPTRRPKLGPIGVGPHPLRPRPEPATGPLHLTRRGRLAASVLTLVALALIGVGLAQAFAPSHPPLTGQRTVTVMPGQSAWDLARAVNPAVDPRVTVDALETVNDIPSAGALEPGQRLVVPVYAAR